MSRCRLGNPAALAAEQRPVDAATRGLPPKTNAATAATTVAATAAPTACTTPQQPKHQHQLLLLHARHGTKVSPVQQQQQQQQHEQQQLLLQKGDSNDLTIRSTPIAAPPCAYTPISVAFNSLFKKLIAALRSSLASNASWETAKSNAQPSLLLLPPAAAAAAAAAEPSPPPAAAATARRIAGESPLPRISSSKM